MTTQPALRSSQLAPLTPPALDRLVRHCLAKDPDERCRPRTTCKLQLQWIADGGSQAGVAAPSRQRRAGAGSGWRGRRCRRPWRHRARRGAGLRVSLHRPQPSGLLSVQVPVRAGPGPRGVLVGARHLARRHRGRGAGPARRRRERSLAFDLRIGGGAPAARYRTGVFPPGRPTAISSRSSRAASSRRSTCAEVRRSTSARSGLTREEARGTATMSSSSRRPRSARSIASPPRGARRRR